MRLFLIKFVTILGIYISLMFVFELYIGYKLKNGNVYTFQGDWLKLKNMDADILFIGNSRTCFHVDPELIDHELKTKTQIISQSGQSIDFIWIKLKEYLKQNKIPKEIYIQSDKFLFNYEPNLVGFESYSPFFWNDRIDFRVIKEKKGYKDYFRFIPLSAVSMSYLYKVIINDTLDGKNLSLKKGFIVQDKNFDETNNLDDSLKLQMLNKNRYLDSMFVLSKKYDIKLYFIVSPFHNEYYQKFSSSNEVNNYVNELSIKYNVDIVYKDFNQKLFDNKSYFYNYTHLNKKGVEVFMDLLIHEKDLFVNFR